MVEFSPEYNSMPVWFFLVPGIVILFVRSHFVTTKIMTGENAISYAAVSLLYHALALPALGVFMPDHVSDYGRLFVWFLYLAVVPALFGVALGVNVQKDLLRRALRRIGLNPIHAIPTAWDWKFGRMTGEWVLVTLRNGTRFAGYCGPDSFVSSDPDNRDLYIQWVYDIDDDSEWRPRGENGVLIAAGEISTIEFWPAEPKEATDDRE